MTDKKISELDAITGSNTAATDVFVVVDTSTGQTKKITREELNNAIEQDVLDSIDIDTINGDFTVNGNINLGDNNKAIFGAGSDLQIYHNGSASLITDVGTGDLFIRGSNSLKLQSADGENYLSASANAFVKLYYNNSEKLATAATGINVTGGITTSDNITMTKTNGAVTIQDATNNNKKGQIQQIAGRLVLRSRNDAANGSITFEGHNSQEYARFNSSGYLGLGTSSPTRPLTVNGNNGAGMIINDAANDKALRFRATGDAFYIEATNNAESAYANLALEGNVGIGTDSPTGNYTKTLHIHGSSSGASLHLTDPTSGATASDGLEIFQYGNDGYIWERENGTLRFGTNAAERMRITSSGNVGIGNSSPTHKVDVLGNFSGSLITRIKNSNAGTGARAGIFLDNDGGNLMALYATSSTYTGVSSWTDAGVISTSSGAAGGLIFNSQGSGGIKFQTGLTERLRITSAGRVGIATDSPNGKLDVSSGNNSDSGYVDLYIGGTDPSNARSGIIRKNTSSPYDMTIKASNYSAGNDLIFDTGAGEKMRIKDTGRVGIGELIPDGLLHLTGDTNSNGAELYLQVNNNNTTDNLGAIHFGNNVDSTLSKILSGTSGANNSSYLTFSTSSAGSQSERARLDSSGNLLVGKTATDSTTAGVDLRPEGVGVFVRDGNRPLIANRLTDDGDLIQFRKDGTTVGAIGSAAGVVSYHVLDPRSGGVGIMGTNLNNIIPTDGTGTPADNAKDLGLGSQRWRNLYLGGTAYISGGSNQITLDTGDQATYGRLDVGHFSNGAFIGTYAGTDAAANILRFGTSGSEHMRVTSAGLVGIGTSLPSGVIHAYKNSGSATILGRFENPSGEAIVEIKSQNDTLGILQFADSEDGNVGAVQYSHPENSMRFKTNDSERMRLEADGDLHVDGNVIAYSTTISDIRLKKDVAPIEDAVTKVQQLNGCTFTYLKDDRKSAGLIAQDVEKVLPSAVIEDEAVFHGEEGETYKTVQYDQVIGLLVEAVKELKAEIEELKDASSK